MNVLNKENIVELTAYCDGVKKICYCIFPDKWLSIYEDKFGWLFPYDCAAIVRERNEAIRDRLNYDSWGMSRIPTKVYLQKLIEDDEDVITYDFRT